MSTFTIVEKLEALDLDSQELIAHAVAATAHAYAPYSNFLVGAAIRLTNGTIITGTNQENAAYPSGMCAERVALYSAISQYPEAEILKMAVIAKRASSKELLPATSCGPCRQVMLEFELRQRKKYEVVMLNQQHQWVKAESAGSLLPFCFTNENLAE